MVMKVIGRASGLFPVIAIVRGVIDAVGNQGLLKLFSKTAVIQPLWFIFPFLFIVTFPPTSLFPVILVPIFLTLHFLPKLTIFPASLLLFLPPPLLFPPPPLLLLLPFLLSLYPFSVELQSAKEKQSVNKNKNKQTNKK
jgi:hypothetical protein